jgi:hypothetical protein
MPNSRTNRVGHHHSPGGRLVPASTPVQLSAFLHERPHKWPGGVDVEAALKREAICWLTPAPWHFLCFLPLPQGHGSLRPTFGLFIGLRNCTTVDKPVLYVPMQCRRGQNTVRHSCQTTRAPLQESSPTPSSDPSTASPASADSQSSLSPSARWPATPGCALFAVGARPFRRGCGRGIRLRIHGDLRPAIGSSTASVLSAA